MIVYNATKEQFQSDVFTNNIENKIHELLYKKIHRRVTESEVRSWKNSMQYMERVLSDDEIPDKSSIAIEYGIPQSSKRIDFIIAGRDENKKDTVIIIELKQWDSVETTQKDAVVKTYVNKAIREKEHPSYQAWTYSALMRDYNSALQDGTIELKPCAYLHNCKSGDAIRDKRYEEHISKAPVFIKSDAMELRSFIKSFIKYGDKNSVMYCIENGKIRPSKQLADALSSMLAGNREFLMIDEQKIIYENIMQAVREIPVKGSRKRVFIVEGGPGTGKSVVAVNLLVDITGLGKVTQYVTKNAAPREVYVSKLTGTMKKTHINNLFKGSGAYHDIEPDTFDALIIDEAHRLNEKSGMFQNIGENQIMELIRASKVSIFFVDDDQVVTFKDIGSKGEIENWAKRLGADVYHHELTSQFRCNGSASYIAWLDNVLDIRQTANFELDNESYDFRVFDDPNEMRDLIEEKNLGTNRARIVAGYCWDWVSKKNDPEAYDIEIKNHNFKMKWNLSSDGNLWILKESSVKEAGCIHTCQGLELDYVGVIIGEDFVVRNGIIQIQPAKRAGTDNSIKGYKKLLTENPSEARKKIEAIVKNTYKTLMTRGQKGCFIYCVDEETGMYFKDFLQQQKDTNDNILSKCPFQILDKENVIPFVNAIPVVNFKAAAGDFLEFRNIDDFDWVILPEPYTARQGYFICQVMGESMNRKIPNGSWCLFRCDQGGTREGKTVLVEHYKIQDMDFGRGFTVKNYHSVKERTADDWRHTKIILRPNSFFTHFTDIVLEENELDELKVVGELVAVLG